MLIRKGRVRQALTNWTGRLTSLLGPDCGECRYCRAAYRLERATAAIALPGLCQDCSQAIPWIREVICSVCGRYEECPDCKRRSTRYFIRNRSAVRYDERMKAWLARYKYRGDERLSELLADVMVHAYRLHQTADRTASAHMGTSLLTFVPLSDSRRLDRGFNQAEQVARALSRRARLPIVDLLQRNRHTEKQSLKSRGDRVRDMRGLFFLHDNGLQEFQRIGAASGATPSIYVVDDVYTTGSTLNECAKAIREGIDAHIYGLTFAR